MNDFFSSRQAITGAFFTFAIGYGFLSAYARRQRLKEWAEDEGLTILATKANSTPDFPDMLSQWRRRTSSCYITVEDREKNVFSGWVNVGGLLAAMFGTKPKVVWDNRPGYLRDGLPPDT
jgi:hypothetical protein